MLTRRDGAAAPNVALVVLVVVAFVIALVVVSSTHKKSIQRGRERNGLVRTGQTPRTALGIVDGDHRARARALPSSANIDVAQVVSVDVAAERRVIPIERTRCKEALRRSVKRRR